MKKETKENLLKLIWPFYMKSSPLKTLIQKRKAAGKAKNWTAYSKLDREIFNLRYREMFDKEPTDAEYEDYQDSPGECRVAFIEDYSVSGMLKSAVLGAAIIAVFIIVTLRFFA